MTSTPAEHSFDAAAKEAALRAESETWDTSSPIDAAPGDVPVIDISSYRTSRDPAVRDAVAAELRQACETVGFWQLTGHGIDTDLIARTFDASAEFHALPIGIKEEIVMDDPSRSLGGVGYLPVGHRKLPARAAANWNEAIVFKTGADISLDDNPWPSEDSVPGFRSTIEEYNTAVISLATELLALYATALGVNSDFFAEAFDPPFGRLRLTHYPAADGEPELGIQPHVDTTFFTLLQQDAPGLAIYHHPKEVWMNVPVVDGAFVVNSGELLKRWTNDRFLSVRHFARVPDQAGSRYSIPLFVNADRDYVMETIPTCVDEGHPAKYAPISYNQSQAAVQGE